MLFSDRKPLKSSLVDAPNARPTTARPTVRFNTVVTEYHIPKKGKRPVKGGKSSFNFYSRKNREQNTKNQASCYGNWNALKHKKHNFFGAGGSSLLQQKKKVFLAKPQKKMRSQSQPKIVWKAPNKYELDTVKTLARKYAPDQKSNHFRESAKLKSCSSNRMKKFIISNRSNSIYQCSLLEAKQASNITQKIKNALKQESKFLIFFDF